MAGHLIPFYIGLCSVTGAFIVNTIEQCGCMDSRCYRKDEFLSYWEEAPAENGTEVLLREKVQGRAENYVNELAANQSLSLSGN